jgi:hypothetical protein
MNNLTRTLLAGSVLMTTAIFSNQASATIIGGINVGPLPSGQTTLQDNSVESVVTAAGQTLNGVGHITAINFDSNFAAAGLELNFVFSTNVDYVSPDGSVIIFDTGRVTFYINAAGTYAPASFSALTGAGSLSAAVMAGTDWLDLSTTTVNTQSPYNLAGAPATGGLFGTGTGFNTSTPTGNGVAYMSVTSGAGLANSFFDTNTFLNGVTPYDMPLTSTFVTPSGLSYAPVADQTNFIGRQPGTTVDEPQSLVLLGFGLLAAATMSKRRVLATHLSWDKS